MKLTTLAVWLVGLIAVVANGAIIYAVIHFIVKFW